VLKNGRVGHISVRKSSGYDILDKAALDTVAKWQFEPGRNRQEIQDMIIDIPVRFSLH
jgi:protein TonB